MEVLRPLTCILGPRSSKFKIPESDEPVKIKWARSPSKYVAQAVKHVRTKLEDVGLGLPKCTTTPATEPGVSTRVGSNDGVQLLPRVGWIS